VSGCRKVGYTDGALCYCALKLEVLEYLNFLIKNHWLLLRMLLYCYYCVVSQNGICNLPA
jgi:hypothetical protein